MVNPHRRSLPRHSFRGEGQFPLDVDRNSRGVQQTLIFLGYSVSNWPSCFGSVTGALQVKFSHTYAAGFPSTSDIARIASLFSPRYFCPSFASAKITIVFGRKRR